MQETNPPKISCPKCGSDQFHSDKKGFSAGKAIGGALLTGGIGLAAGAIGSNKIIITCLNCGNQYKPGDKKVEHKSFTPTPQKTIKDLVPEITDQEIKKSEVPTAIGCFILFIIVVAVAISLFGK
ncbi:hypothetical protein ACFOWM_03360 [Ferruginibacter yonginensis]|uniref:LITAF domain-containing protein n=1 Tax=Ferruginibacter yonginensis TaxID=1310416 RepID=A0ABV8QNW3_9BACT